MDQDHDSVNSENRPDDRAATLARLTVARAADDLRRSLPVIVRDGGDTPLLVMAAELTGDPDRALWETRAGATARLALTRHRADTLHIHNRGRDAVAIEIPDHFRADDIAAIADPTQDLAHPFMGPFRTLTTPDRAAEAAGLALLKQARLLPAALIFDLTDEAARGLQRDYGLLATDADAIRSMPLEAAARLTRVADAHVPLAGADSARVIAFRPENGGLEHLAILIGNPSPHDPVLARLHSECFTGDLIGSLKCDCGDQLKGAVREINEAGSGVILYLAQEGRGIGLTSKLKAYALQDQGYDTVDANTRLGFDVDERLFSPAATMLKALGMLTVRLMTNNPEKVEALTRFGICVAERVAHRFPANKHNEQYLKVKKDRTGHLL